ncbi:MAG TPA: hypothetical protein VNE42_11430 [Acidimicrobiales bacterium]|nr:hypothetical protein [Acidimicrobiales bacterium]
MRPPPARTGDYARIIRLALFFATIISGVAVSSGAASVQRAQRSIHVRQAPRDISPIPNFMNICYPDGYDVSDPCFTQVANALQHALDVEHVPVQFDLANIELQSPVVQLFIAANIDRTARGLAPVEELVSDLNTVAARGVASGSDPVLSASPSVRIGGENVVGWGSNWGRQTYNALGTEYFWMYEDGPHGYNLACKRGHAAGCMGHRMNILATYDNAKPYCANHHLILSMGAAFAVSHSAPSFSEIFVATCRAPRGEVIARWNSFKHTVVIPK